MYSMEVDRCSWKEWFVSGKLLWDEINSFKVFCFELDSRLRWSWWISYRDVDNLLLRWSLVCIERAGRERCAWILIWRDPLMVRIRMHWLWPILVDREWGYETKSWSRVAGKEVVGQMEGFLGKSMMVKKRTHDLVELKTIWIVVSTKHQTVKQSRRQFNANTTSDQLPNW